MQKSIVIKPESVDILWGYIVQASQPRMAGYVYSALFRPDLIRIEIWAKNDRGAGYVYGTSSHPDPTRAKIRVTNGLFVFLVGSLANLDHIPRVSQSSKRPAYQRPQIDPKTKQRAEQIVATLQSGTPYIVEDNQEAYPVIAAVVLIDAGNIIIERDPPKIRVWKEGPDFAALSNL